MHKHHENDAEFYPKSLVLAAWGDDNRLMRIMNA